MKRLFIALVLLCVFVTLAWSADRYWVGCDGNVNDTAHWSTGTGGAGGASKPGSSDVAITDAASCANAYTLTINEATTWGGATLGAPTSGNLTIVTDANKTRYLAFAGNATVTGTPNIGGNSAVNRLLVASNAIGTARTITSTGATVTWSNTDFRDITSNPAIDLSARTDIGGGTTLTGCSGITFPAAVDQYFYKASGNDNWSTAGNWYLGEGGTGGAGRIPLIQDTAKMKSGFGAASMTLTQDMPRIGSLDFTGATNSPTLTPSTATSVFGSITLISAMTLTNSTQTYTFEGRGSYTLTSGGKTWAKDIWLQAPGGTLTLLDNLVTTSTYINVWAGTFNANNFNVTTQTFGSNYTNTRATILGAGTWTLTGTGTVWNPGGTSPNIDTTGSTIKLTGSTSATKTFAGAGLTYNIVWFSPGAGTGEFDITGGNTIAELKDDGTAAHSVKFTKSTTTTIGTWSIRGNSGALITLDTVDGAGTFTLTKSGGGKVCADYLNIYRSVAGGTGATWYAGANSTNNNGAGSGWIFGACPSGYRALLGVGK